MLQQLRNWHFYLMVAGDMVLFVLSLVVAYLIRFDFALTEEMFRQSLCLIPLVVLVKTVSFFSFGLYRGMWRYSSLSDVWRLFQATVFSSLVIVCSILFVHHFHGYSRGIFVIDAGLTFLLTSGLRFSIRLLHYHGVFCEVNSVDIIPSAGLDKKRVMLIGAGDAGEMTLRELLDNRAKKYEIVGIVDDDPNKRKRLIHGIPVRGTIDDLPHLTKKFYVMELIIAIPSATGSQMRRIVEVCERCNVSYKTLPGICELVDGKVSVRALRDLRYEDILGREPVRMDMSGIAEYLTGRTVLVTGGGGSIGSELCRQIIRFDPDKLVLMDACEANLYQIQMELEHERRFNRYTTVLGKVTNRTLTESVFAGCRPDIVFHAAAYKHVPMLERNPWEAAFNNILGSRITMEAATKYGVKRFVLVSTDKAVYPTNVMGASKRVTELIMLCMQNHSTRFMTVRFGNVVGSSGSVIPLFRRQIECGGPVTVTHPDVTRYFMSIPEAAQLILQAGSMGEGGEIFILKMGKPVRIADMARDLIRLSGKEPDKDIKIVFTGLREGEKLYEELITVGEGIVATPHEKIMVLRSNGQINGHKGRDAFCVWLNGQLDELFDAANRFDANAIKKKLKDIVPEYTPSVFTDGSH